ncbi:hypothetical protein DN069_21440 [Streptacidiphilus pinicola]|uniref:Uncharacterized protein n=1 Tax=Streptacidiphilus pinicola TaxID=2219663 RepID=A0A2X0IEV4_9ACTN|nr:hypothetical protein [Streptacidiphilus pinicola]RAG83562.1 hypothetical protein DN069_21440 [Streptacidiphilus pinicola]
MDATMDRVMTGYFRAALIEAGGPEASTPAAEYLRQRQSLWRERAAMEPSTAAEALRWASRRVTTAEDVTRPEALEDRNALECWMADRQIYGFRYIRRTLQS